MIIIDKDKPRVRIMIGERASRVEQHAAKELGRYVELISGVRLSVLKDNQGVINKATNLILIGSPKTNRMVSTLSKKGLVKLSSNFPGLDGFIIKTVEESSKNYLVLGGSMERGSLYAVYELLEKYFNIGFFRDGDRTPKSESLVIPEIDRAERPLFKIRMFMEHPTISDTYLRSPRLWMFPEWKKEMDWMVKKKFNCMELFHSDEESLFPMFAMAYPDFDGEEFGNVIYPVEYKQNLYRQISIYAKSIGLQIAHNLYPRVPKLSYSLHAGAIYHEVPFAGPKHVYDVCPSDPEIFKKCIKPLWKAQIEILGKDSHLYLIFPPFWEMPPCKHVKSRGEGILEMYEVVKELDPEAEVYACVGWPSSMDPGVWKCFEEGKIPPEVGILDMQLTPGLIGYPPFWKMTNYWEGRRWIYWDHISFEAHELPYLMASPRRLIKNVRKAVEHNAVGFTAFNIAANSNQVLCNFSGEFSWQSKGLVFQKFLRRYCYLRYGPQSAQNMFESQLKLNKACEKLASKDICNDYFLRLPTVRQVNDWYHVFPESLEEAKQALEIGEGEHKKQADNELFRNDLFELRTVYHYINYFKLLVEGLAHLDEKKIEGSKEVLKKLVEHFKINPDYVREVTWKFIRRELPEAKRVVLDCPFYLTYDWLKQRLNETPVSAKEILSRYFYREYLDKK